MGLGGRVRGVVAKVAGGVAAWAVRGDWADASADPFRLERRRNRVFATTTALEAFLRDLAYRGPGAAVQVRSLSERETWTAPWPEVVDELLKVSDHQRSVIVASGVASLLDGSQRSFVVSVGTGRGFLRNTCVQVSGGGPIVQQFARELADLVDENTVRAPRTEGVPVVTARDLRDANREAFEAGEYRKARRAGIWAGIISGVGATGVTELAIHLLK